MTKLLIIGIDGASWRIIKPNLVHLPNFEKMIKEGESKSLLVKDDPILSAAIWCTIFSGKTTEEHNHRKFVVDGKLQTREDIKVDFIWDILNKNYDIKVLQIPFVMPPYNFNCDYKPIGYGASSDLKELEEDTQKLAERAEEVLKENPEIFIVVFGALDKVQHFHWGEDLILDWYKKIDKIIGRLAKYGKKIIIVSDHGFCSRGEARIQTLPDKNDKGKPLKGDHHEEAILITKNIDYSIKKHKDIFQAMLHYFQL
jgi:predicted AlkP superfamily phosphohydrolase/phosphomutase